MKKTAIALRGIALGLGILITAFGAGIAFTAGSVQYLTVKSDIPLCISIVDKP